MVRRIDPQTAFDQSLSNEGPGHWLRAEDILSTLMRIALRASIWLTVLRKNWNVIVPFGRYTKWSNEVCLTPGLDNTRPVTRQWRACNYLHARLPARLSSRDAARCGLSSCSFSVCRIIEVWFGVAWRKSPSQCDSFQAQHTSGIEHASSWIEPVAASFNCLVA